MFKINFYIFILLISLTYKNVFAQDTIIDKNLECNDSKIKGLSLWQIKRKVNFQDFKIKNIKRSITKSKEDKININDISYSESKKQNNISFKIEKNNLSAFNSITTEIIENEILVFKEFVSFPLLSNETIIGETLFTNSLKAKYIINNNFEISDGLNHDGIILFENFKILIVVKQKALRRFVFEFVLDDKTIGKTNTDGNICIQNSLDKELEILLIAISCVINFNFLNNNN